MFFFQLDAAAVVKYEYVKTNKILTKIYLVRIPAVWWIKSYILLLIFFTFQLDRQSMKSEKELQNENNYIYCVIKCS